MDGKETSPLKTQPEGQVPLAEELPSTEKKTKPAIDPRRVAVEKRLAETGQNIINLEVYTI